MSSRVRDLRRRNRSNSTRSFLCPFSSISITAKRETPELLHACANIGSGDYVVYSRRNEIIVRQPTMLVKSTWYTLKICYVFIIAPCSMMKAIPFPKLRPPPLPPYNAGSRGHFERTDPTLYGEGWGGGRDGEIFKKGQVYHDFSPGLYFSQNNYIKQQGQHWGTNDEAARN